MMNKMDLRHKEANRLFLKEYFELFFPDIAPRMNFKSAEFRDKELIDLVGGNPYLTTSNYPCTTTPL